jgi:hypothetical protein
VQSRDLIDNEQQDTRDDKGPCGARGGGRELVTHLDPVTGPPAARVGVVHAVHGGHVGGGEEAREDVADESADAVDSEDVEAFVDADEVLVLWDSC